MFLGEVIMSSEGALQCIWPTEEGISVVTFAFLSIFSINLEIILLANQWRKRSKRDSVFSCVLVTNPYDVLSQVWYWNVTIPNLGLLPYFYYS